LSEEAVTNWLTSNGYGKRRPKATAETVHNHADVAKELKQAEGGVFAPLVREL